MEGVNKNFEKEDIEEWCDKADEEARQCGIAFGFKSVNNWDDARKEAQRLIDREGYENPTEGQRSKETAVMLQKVGKRLMDLIPK
ncbi:MAG: hypothetical protein WC839_02370 [Candidatus Paceibacterota bacterium]